MEGRGRGEEGGEISAVATLNPPENKKTVHVYTTTAVASFV